MRIKHWFDPSIARSQWERCARGERGLPPLRTHAGMASPVGQRRAAGGEGDEPGGVRHLVVEASRRLITMFIVNMYSFRRDGRGVT
ncbi:hypothetical protein GCM10022254_17040 [Actinomadura meridiana]|uniref:Uncharacterized protein n=1 Tax=Actinomadura meridiana TaxID=559626 RepID=A0ABP8BX34_9ACTN